MQPNSQKDHNKILTLEHIEHGTVRAIKYTGSTMVSVLFCGKILAVGTLENSVVLVDLELNQTTKRIKIHSFMNSDLFCFHNYLLVGSSFDFFAIDLTSQSLIDFPKFRIALNGLVSKIAVYKENQNYHLFCAADKNKTILHLDVSEYFFKGKLKPGIHENYQHHISIYYKNLEKMNNIDDAVIFLKKNMPARKATRIEPVKVGSPDQPVKSRIVSKATKLKGKNPVNSNQNIKLPRKIQKNDQVSSEMNLNSKILKKNDAISRYKLLQQRLLAQVSKQKAQIQKLHDQASQHKAHSVAKDSLIQQLQSKISQLQGNCARSKSQIAQKQILVDDLNSHIQNLQHQITALNSRAEAELASQVDTASRLQRQVVALKAQLEQATHGLARSQAKVGSLEALGQQIKSKCASLLEQNNRTHAAHLERTVRKLAKQSQSEIAKLTAVYGQKLADRGTGGAQAQRERRLSTVNTACTQTPAVREPAVQTKLAQNHQEILDQKKQLKEFKEHLISQFERFKQKESQRILQEELSKIRQRQKQYYLDVDDPDPKASIFRDLTNLVKLFSRVRHGDYEYEEIG